MKSILLSVQPKWVKKILDGEKTIEIRKKIPKCELPCKVYIYCSKKTKLWMHNKKTIILGNTDLTSYLLNGEVVAEFTLNKVDLLIDCGFGVHYVDNNLNDLDLNYLLTNSCLTEEQIYSYLGLKENSGYYNDGYVWHINNLIVYDRPKNLMNFAILTTKKDKDFEVYNNNKTYYYKYLHRPPQSWCYVEKMEVI